MGEELERTLECPRVGLTAVRSSTPRPEAVQVAEGRLVVEVSALEGAVGVPIAIGTGKRGSRVEFGKT